MNYYTYKITFKDLPKYFYYGKRKYNGKEYFGSPTTWAFLWLLFEPEVQILQWFETEEEVTAAEVSILKATWKDKYSLNESCGRAISEEICRASGKANVAALNAHPNTVAARKANGKANAAAMNSHPNPAANRKANGK